MTTMERALLQQRQRQMRIERRGVPLWNVPSRPTSENIEAFISGVSGAAPMDGVLSYPYTVPQRIYLRDSGALVASTIQHPYMATAKPCGSTPHNLLSGMSYSDTPSCLTVTEASYGAPSILASRSQLASGIRVEQL